MNASHFAIAEAAASFGHYRPMPIEDLRRQAPAVFANGAHEKVGRRYTFIPTGRVVSGLMDAGFLPVAARQTRARRGSVEHARHLVRFRRRFETVALRDSVPELWRAAHNSGYPQLCLMRSSRRRGLIGGRA